MIAIDRTGFWYSDFGDAQNLRYNLKEYRSLSKKSIIKAANL
jgi:hypothetical protein